MLPNIVCSWGPAACHLLVPGPISGFQGLSATDSWKSDDWLPPDPGEQSPCRRREQQSIIKLYDPDAACSSRFEAAGRCKRAHRPLALPFSHRWRCQQYRDQRDSSRPSRVI